jgi:hypothetical protein
MQAAIAPELPALAEEIVEVIRREVPEYARPMSGAFGRGIRVGVEEALQRFGAPDTPLRPDVYRALGRGEHRVGRSLDALQSAYRIGARVAWRRLSRAAEAAGVPVADQHALAEAIFAYIDEIAAESVEGYAAAQAEQAGDRHRRREALLALISAPIPPDPGVLEAAAAEAAWPLPRRVAVIACSDEHPGRVARRLSGDALHGRVGDQLCVLVGDPVDLAKETAATADRLETQLGLGPTVPVGEARRSLRWAVRALSLLAPGQRLVIADERLADIALQADPDVLAALRARALGVLADETPRSRARLTETLASWLRHAGARAAVAGELGVHPQTVRYRVARLRELFGARLDDPEARFELMLALRAFVGGVPAGPRSPPPARRVDS